VAATGAISAKVATLTNGVLKTMLLNNLKIATGVLILVVLLALGIGVGVLRISAAAAEPTGTPASGDEKREAKVKWEYKAIRVRDIETLAPRDSGDKLTEGLNALGEQGWELVAVQPGATVAGFGGPGTMTGGSHPSIYLFKRAR
jgi:hypothetical protein